jgi:hypothetical protein
LRIEPRSIATFHPTSPGPGLPKSEASSDRHRTRADSPLRIEIVGAEVSPERHSKHTQTPSVDGPAVGRHTLGRPPAPERFGGWPFGKSRRPGVACA